MALITKIRRNFWLLLLVIGFALASFILMDASGPGGGGGSAQTTMGMINGQKIDYKDYQMAESVYYQGSQGETFGKRESIWNFFVEQALLKDVSAKTGIGVGADEMMDLQFGANRSPIMQQNWGQNPQALASYKTQVEEGTLKGPIADFWKQQSKQIGKAKVQEKLTNLVSKAIYTPTWMAEASFKDDNTKVDFEYVKIPFDMITNEVVVSDSDYQNHINKYPARFTEKVETRNIQYTVFDVIATSQDSAEIRSQIDSLKVKFGDGSTTDSLFALTNGGVYTPYYNKNEYLPETMKETIKTVADGEIYGPYVDQGNYTLFKRIASRNVADTVKAQQILINADPNNAIQVANANNKIDSLERLYNRGISFDTLAVKNSQDGSAFNGGDMGIITQLGLYQANPALTEAIFWGGKEGGVYKVKSQQGIHLVKINEMTYSDDEPEYKVAMVGLPIVPSQDTQNAIADQVSDLILSNKDVGSLSTALSGLGKSLQTSSPVKENDYTLDALGAGDTSREIIKWAFDAVRDAGDISTDVHTFTDPINYYDSKYVIATLKSINPKGMQSVESLKSTLQSVVMNRKKAEAFTNGLTVTSLEDLASQYGATVETASDASLGSPFIPGIGNEPEVVGVAYKTANQAISNPIIGQSGVYVIKPMSKADAGQIVNLPSIQKNVSTSMRSQVSFNLLESLKSAAKIEDNRSTFY